MCVFEFVSERGGEGVYVCVCVRVCEMECVGGVVCECLCRGGWGDRRASLCVYVCVCVCTSV